MRNIFVVIIEIICLFLDFKFCQPKNSGLAAIYLETNGTSGRQWMHYIGNFYCYFYLLFEKKFLFCSPLTRSIYAYNLSFGLQLNNIANQYWSMFSFSFICKSIFTLTKVLFLLKSLSVIKTFYSVLLKFKRWHCFFATKRFKTLKSDFGSRYFGILV